MFRIRLCLSAAFIFAIVACVGGQDPKKPADPKPADPKPADPKPADGKRFEPMFAKDKKFYQEVTTEVEQIIKVQGQDLAQKQSSTFWFEWTPTEQKPDGKWLVKQKVEGLKMTIDISGNLITFDSSKPDSPTSGNPGLNEFFKKLVGAEFTPTIDKSYKVESVAGRTEFVKSIGAGNPQLDGLLNKIMTDDALKQMCDPTLGIVPDASKKVGDTWERDTKLDLGPIGKYDLKYKFKYASTDKDIDKIEVEPVLTYTAPKDNPEGLLFRIKSGNLTQPPLAPGEQPAKGTILYNSKTGQIESAEIKIKLRGELTVTIGGTDTKVELSQTQTTSFKGSSEKSFKPAAPKP